MNQQYVQKWFRDDGDNTLRVNYPLDSNSVVLDLGGYEGAWAEKIYNKYKCNIYVFEPIPKLYDNIVNKFEGNNKIKIFPFGVSDEDKLLEISLLEDGSSFYSNSENKLLTKVVSFVDFITKNKIQNVDLIKINIEGDEFPVLISLLENNMINIFKNIQVQFHNIDSNSIKLRNEIREKLSLTHKLTYDYTFVWENWEKI